MTQGSLSSKEKVLLLIERWPTEHGLSLADLFVDELWKVLDGRIMVPGRVRFLLLSKKKIAIKPSCLAKSSVKKN